MFTEKVLFGTTIFLYGAYIVLIFSFVKLYTIKIIATV